MDYNDMLPYERAIYSAKARLRSANEGAMTRGRKAYTRDCEARGVRVDYHSLTQDERYRWELSA